MAEKPTQKMSQRERMLAGLLYNAADRELCEARIRAKHLTYLTIHVILRTWRSGPLS